MSALRRLHSRIVGLGSVCGLAPSPPAEVFLKSLPPPSEVDPAKYRRFQREERGQRSASSPRGESGTAEHHRRRSPEPFYEIVAGGSGHKHVALLTREGHLITFGENRYGQTAAPKKDDEEGRESGGVDPSAGSEGRAGGRAPSFTFTSPSLSTLPSRHAHSENPDWAPLFIDLGDAFTGPDMGAATPALVSCGSNFTIAYQPGGRRAVAFGNNHVGQLGVGHKNRVDSERGFEEWNPLASWWPSQRESVLATIVSGYNHSIVQLTCGSLFAFGSNTWGELSVGTTVSPMQPERITYFQERNRAVRKVAAGNSFTLFLTADGRVYGCGATNFGQLPSNSFDPVPVPLVRTYVVDGAAVEPGRFSSGHASQKLIRIKDLACVGNLAVYVSVGNELLVQGSLPEYGVATQAPRLALIDQAEAIAALKQRMSELGWSREEIEAPDGFVIRGLAAGPSTLLVRFQNGCVGALGANSEGQLHNVTKSINGRAVNLAPSFSSGSLLPVLAPSAAFRRESFETLSARTTFLCGSGFTLLIDNDEVYPVKEHVKPIELPPGRATAPPPRGSATDTASPAPTAPKERAAGQSRRERLRSSLK